MGRWEAVDASECAGVVIDSWSPKLKQRLEEGVVYILILILSPMLIPISGQVFRLMAGNSVWSMRENGIKKVIFPYFRRVPKHKRLVAHKHQGSDTLTMSGVAADCRTPLSTPRRKVWPP